MCSTCSCEVDKLPPVQACDNSENWKPTSCGQIGLSVSRGNLRPSLMSVHKSAPRFIESLKFVIGFFSSPSSCTQLLSFPEIWIARIVVMAAMIQQLAAQVHVLC